MSFIDVGIHCNNHHLFAACERIDGTIMWANLHLLFRLSLIPFVTGWMENHLTGAPTVLYGFALLTAAIAYFILQSRILASELEDSRLRAEIGSDSKGKISTGLSIAGIATAFFPSTGVRFLHSRRGDMACPEQTHRARRSHRREIEGLGFL